MAYFMGALLTWIGYGSATYALFAWLKVLLRQPRVATAATASGVAAVTLIAGHFLFPSRALQIPLAWVLMPFAGWVAVASTGMVFVRLWQAVASIDGIERRAKLFAAAAWTAALVAALVGVRVDREAQLKIFTGGIPISLPALFGLMALAACAMTAMTLSARLATTRKWTRGAIIHLTLVVGSLLFGVPFAWLLLTSFKEDIDMASKDGIIWVPKVTETAKYFSKTNPMFEIDRDGEKVQGVVVGRSGSAVTLDIQKPMSLRGVTVTTDSSRVREVAREVPVVTASVDGIRAQGRVIDNLNDGRAVVEFSEPASLRGKQHTYLPSRIQPVRHPGLRWQNYPDALDFLPPEAKHGFVYLRNTLIVVILSLVGTVLSSALVAYGFSRIRFPGREAIFFLMLSTMMLPGAVTRLPQFMIFRSLGWIDTLLPLWVPSFFGSAVNIFLLRQFFRQIPMELDEAAKVDGCGYLRSFWSVMLPQIKPALAVVSITTVVASWNDFLGPLIYINSPEKMTITYAVNLYANDRAGEVGLVTAFTTMSMLPVLLLFFFTQRYFIEGVSLSGFGGR